MATIQELFNEKQWNEIYKSHTPFSISRELGFRNALNLAYHLLYNPEWDECMQEYAVTLIFTIKGMYPNEWKKDWIYDVFLGDACDVTLKYDDRYMAYKQAYEIASPPPPRLLVNLARCCACPGLRPISYDQAIELLKKATSIHPYLDAIGQLKSIYHSKADKKEENYWSKIYNELEHKNIESPAINFPFIDKT